MRIAVAASLLKPISAESTGGTEAFAHILSEGLLAKGEDVTLFATSDSKTNAKLESIIGSENTTGVYEGSVEIRLAYQTLQIADILKKSSEFDIIHNNYFHFFQLTSMSGFSQCPIVTSMHNHYWQFPNLKSILSKTVRKDKDVVVFASKAAQRYAGDLFNNEIIYHGIDVNAFEYSPESQDYFLYLGRIVESKGIGDAVKAAKQGGFNLKISGGSAVIPKEIEFVKENIEPLFSEKIQNLGVTTESERNELYRGAKALIFPTHIEEQFGLVAAEAMASGTPVIAYNLGALSEVVEDGVSGFIIDPDDSERPGKGSWIIKKQGVEGILEAVGRINEINREACRKRVEEHFTVEKMVDNYIDLYNRLLSK
jgi:glycosyltransferase involved in cell wall biosynthesis